MELVCKDGEQTQHKLVLCCTLEGKSIFSTFLVQLEMFEVPVMYECLCAKLLKSNEKKWHGPEMCPLRQKCLAALWG